MKESKESETHLYLEKMVNRTIKQRITEELPARKRSLLEATVLVGTPWKSKITG
jgi:hypothetical protein